MNVKISKGGKLTINSTRFWCKASEVLREMYLIGWSVHSKTFITYRKWTPLSQMSTAATNPEMVQSSLHIKNYFSVVHRYPGLLRVLFLSVTSIKTLCALLVISIRTPCAFLMTSIKTHYAFFVTSVNTLCTLFVTSIERVYTYLFTSIKTLYTYCIT